MLALLKYRALVVYTLDDLEKVTENKLRDSRGIGNYVIQECKKILCESMDTKAN